MATQGQPTDLDDIVVHGVATFKGNVDASVGTLKHNQVVEYAFYVSGAQTTGTGKSYRLVDVAGTILSCRAHLITAPTTTSFIADVMKNGTTIYSTTGNRPTVAATTNDSGDTVAPDVTALVAGDVLRLDVIQIGSGTAGSDLMVVVKVKQQVTV